MTEKVEGIVLVPEPSCEYLNDHQLVNYRDHCRKFVKWALNMGKDPKHADGYAHSTVRQRAYRLDKFYRWCGTKETATHSKFAPTTWTT